MVNIYESKDVELKADLEADINYYVSAFESKKSEYKKADAVGIYNSTVGGFLERIRQQQP